MTDLISTGQAAAILGVSPCRVAQLLAEGRLTVALALPLRNVLRRRDVERLARQRARQARGDRRVRVAAVSEQ